MGRPTWILVAEDDDNDRFFISRAFEEIEPDIKLVFAYHGKEVFECLWREGRFLHRPLGPPAVLILDYSMPVCSGLEVLARIRATPETQYLPVVMHSGQMNPFEIAEAYRLGANAYVEKPFGLNELVGIFKEMGIFWGRINISPPVAVA